MINHHYIRSLGLALLIMLSGHSRVYAPELKTYLWVGGIAAAALAGYTLATIKPALFVKKLTHVDFNRLGVRYLDHLEFKEGIQGESTGDSKEASSIGGNKDFVSLAHRYGSDLDAHAIAPIYLAWINPQIGYGVFAAQDIAPGQMIGEYTGIVRKLKWEESGAYAWQFPSRGLNLIVDAAKAGNMIRFINHSDNPNVDVEYIPYNKQWHVVYIAKERIAKDEQLFVNYGPDYWRSKKQVTLYSTLSCWSLIKYKINQILDFRI